MAKSQSAFAKLGTGAKMLVALLLVTLVGVLYFVVFYSDIATQLRAGKTRQQQLEVDLAEAKKAQHAYQMDLAELSEKQQKQQELNKILPATTEYPAFLSAVQSVSNITGASLTAWTPQDEVPEQFYARVPMKLDLEGRFHQIARFFYQVGQLDRIINMENITMTEPRTEGDEVILKVNALATAFHSIDESKAANPAGVVGAAGAPPPRGK